MNNRLWFSLLALAALLGCSPEKPVRIGFIGGLSDRGSDVGEGGRNGLMLAVEQRNANGGINGRKIELLIQDDGQNPEKAGVAIKTLVDAKVDAVVGPFISAIAAVVVPVANEARLVMVSPTVTGGAFVGKDDYFIRINRTTRDNARDYAQQLFKRGQKQVSVAYDTRNRSYSESWLNEFELAFAALGGRTVAKVPFESQPETALSDIVRKMLAAKPDGLLFITNTVDVARLSQQAAKLAPALPKSAAEWATSDALIELGGQAVEGLLIAQAFNRDDHSERFRQFHDAYQIRFGREPVYSALNGYDAAIVLMQAMSRQTGDETLKAAVLKYGPYEGLQQPIQFDQFGDTARLVYFTEIRTGRFVLVK